LSESTEARFAEFEALGKEWAVAKAQHGALEEWKKIVLAREMKLAEARGATSAAAQERDARASNTYAEAVDAVHAADEKALALGMKIKSLEMRFEHWRTVQATRRAEIQLR
jgi:hypothetical protein